MPHEPTWVSYNVLLLSILRTELPGSISSFIRKGWYDPGIWSSFKGQVPARSPLTRASTWAIPGVTGEQGSGNGRLQNLVKGCLLWTQLNGPAWNILLGVVVGRRTDHGLNAIFLRQGEEEFFFLVVHVPFGNSLTQSLPGSKLSMTVSYNIFIDSLLIDDSRNFRVELDTSDVTTAPTQVLAPSRYQQTSSPFKYQQRFYWV